MAGDQNAGGRRCGVRPLLGPDAHRQRAHGVGSPPSPEDRSPQAHGNHLPPHGIL